MRRIAALDHERHADVEVVGEVDLRAPLRRVRHPADHRVALLREQRGDDPVEADVLELGPDAHQPPDPGADVDVGPDRGRAVARFHRRIAEVRAEDDLARLGDARRRCDAGSGIRSGRKGQSREGAGKERRASLHFSCTSQ